MGIFKLAMSRATNKYLFFKLYKKSFKLYKKWSSKNEEKKQRKT